MEQIIREARGGVKLGILAFALICLGFSNSSFASLVAYYPFNGNANDESGNGNNGTVFGATLTTDRFGNPNSAYSFNGFSDFIKASGSGLPTGARTVILWFDATTVANHPALLGYGGGACGTSFFMALNDIALAPKSYYVSSHCGVNTLKHPYTTDPSGAWHNFAITTDSSGTDMYVDGALVASNTNFISNTTVAGTDLAIGVDVNPGGIAPYTDFNVNYFDGKIDDVCIYDTALTSSQIAASPCGTVVAPAPEPRSSALLAVGLVALVAITRRSRPRPGAPRRSGSPEGLALEEASDRSRRISSALRLLRGCPEQVRA